ncbi:hypothetical protein D9M73_270240 [compost metagenome]
MGLDQFLLQAGCAALVLVQQVEYGATVLGPRAFLALNGFPTRGIELDDVAAAFGQLPFLLHQLLQFGQVMMLGNQAFAGELGVVGGDALGQLHHLRERCG